MKREAQTAAAGGATGVTPSLKMRVHPVEESPRCLAKFAAEPIREKNKNAGCS